VPIDALLLPPELPKEPLIRFSVDRQNCCVVWVSANPRSVCQTIQDVLSAYNPLLMQCIGNTLIAAVPYVKGKKQYLALLNTLYQLMQQVGQQQAQHLVVQVRMDTVFRSSENTWVLRDAVLNELSAHAKCVPNGAILVEEAICQLSSHCYGYSVDPLVSNCWQLLKPVAWFDPVSMDNREADLQQWRCFIEGVEVQQCSAIFTVSGPEGCGKTQLLRQVTQCDEVLAWHKIVLDFEMLHPESSLVKEFLHPALHDSEAKQTLVVLDNLHLIDTHSFVALIDLIQALRAASIGWVVGCSTSFEAQPLLDELRQLGLRSTHIALDALPVRAALQGALLQYKFDTLTDEEKYVLAVLSYGLHKMSRDELLALPNVSIQTIQMLQSLGLIRVSFRNTVCLMHDEVNVIVQGVVPDAMRRSIYEFLAQQVQQRCLADDTLLGYLGEYCLGAGKPCDAARAFFDYGQMWTKQYNYQQASDWLNRALEALLNGASPASQTDLLLTDIRLGLARINSVSKGWVSHSSILAYQQCMGLAARQPCTLRHCVALAGKWIVQLMAMEFEASEVTAHEILLQAQQGSEPFGIALAHSCLANTQFWLGKHQLAIEHAEHACLCYQINTDVRLVEGIGFNPLGLACCFGGLSASILCESQKLAFFLQYHTLEVLTQNPFNRVMVLQGEIWCAYHQRHVDRVHALSTQLLQLSDQHHFPFYRGVALLFLGWSQSVRCPDQAAQCILVVEEGYNDWLASSGDQIAHSLYALIKSDVFALAGQSSQAIELLEYALDLAHKKNELCYLAPLYAKLAVLKPHAAQYAARARQIAREQGACLFMEQEWQVA
jgi:tetratricopeptide (TPR) repeat protein